jgi:hypothetical protein
MPAPSRFSIAAGCVVRPFPIAPSTALARLDRVDELTTHPTAWTREPLRVYLRPNR